MLRNPLTSAPSPRTFWLILGVSAATFGPAPIPGFGAVNLSLFDLAVPALALWGFLGGWLRKPSWPVVAGCAAIILTITAHSAVLGIVVGVPNYAGLVKETIKLVGVVTLFGLARTLLEDRRYQSPETFTIGVAFVLILLAIGFLANAERYEDLHAMLGATATGLGILAGLSMVEKKAFAVRAATIFSICLVAALWLASKTYAVTALALMATGALGSLVNLKPARSIAVSALLAVLLFGAAFGSFAFLFRMLSLDPAKRPAHATVETVIPGIAITSTESSQARRFDLWREGIAVGLNSLPAGIGLGQFNAKVAAGMSESYLRSTSPHNTPLALFVEMGVLGLLLIGTLAVAAWRAAAGYPTVIAIMVILLAGPSALLHDVQGMRILILLLALGLARIASKPDARRFGIPYSVRDSRVWRSVIQASKARRLEWRFFTG